MKLSIVDAGDPRVADYRDLADAGRLRARGIFVAEGRLVVRRVLEHGDYRVRSLLMTAAARAGLADVLEVATGLAVYEASLDVMREITGFNIHRGCLALVERPAPRSLTDVLALAGASRLLVVLEEISNADNIGGVFRNALAFGAGAVLLSPGCGDPFYRKAVRTSMAATFRVPFARIEPWPERLEALKEAGFALVALTPSAQARDLGAFVSDARRPARVALLVGTEGAGLSAGADALAVAHVRIPMAPGVDSLNLATATGIALYCTSISTPPISPAARL